jgi:hypothetical protein
MSTPLALAAVTAVLQDVLHNGFAAYNLSSIMGDIEVSALPPDRVPVSGSSSSNRINLFLYQVTQNPGWRGVGLPSRDSRGERIANPPLALDLHYLLTAYGTRELYPEILLGHAMQLLHQGPVLTRDAIRGALAPAAPPPGFPTALAGSELAEQVEQLKITLQNMSTEEVSRLWAAMQAPYRPTVGCQVTVVLIEGHRPAKVALPVLGRNVYVLPLRRPTIERIVAADGADLPITAGTKLLIQGRGLRADDAEVRIGGVDLAAAAAVGEREIVVELSDPLPAGLRAGVQAVQVVHHFAMGTPPEAHRSEESNLGTFVLHPLAVPVLDAAAGEIEVTFEPKVGKAQRVVLLLNQADAPAAGPARAYSFKAPFDNGITGAGEETDTIRFAYQDVEPGPYLVRVQVDGAESLLTVDGTGKYATPQVVIP